MPHVQWHSSCCRHHRERRMVLRDLRARVRALKTEIIATIAIIAETERRADSSREMIAAALIQTIEVSRTLKEAVSRRVTTATAIRADSLIRMIARRALRERSSSHSLS